MASGKEIKQQIASIKSTQKITSAMQLVASSKMRQAQLNRLASQPYARKIREVSFHLAAANLNYQHPFLNPRSLKRAGFIVVSTDRGLCGGLNINLFKAVTQEAKKLDEQGVSSAFCAFGSKGVSFFRHFGGQLLALKTGLGDSPALGDLLPSIKIMLDAFVAGTIDRLYIVANQYLNTMTQKPSVRQLLPLVKNEDSPLMSQGSWIYLYEPDDPKLILDQLLIRYVESQVFQAVVENIACEQAARMIAMKSATDNADQLIDDLQMDYNKARQAAITQEISEIVSGAAAV